MFSLSGPCVFYCLLDLSCGECNVIPCIFCVACLTVSVNCLVTQFEIFLGVVVILC